MLVGLYRTKKELMASVGQPLHVEPTNILVGEELDRGCVTVVSSEKRGSRRRWWAEVTIIHGRIVRVD